MYYYDLLLESPLDVADLAEVLAQVLRQKGKFVQSGYEPEAPDVWYIAQPEELLLMLAPQPSPWPPAPEAPGDFRFHVRIQPYNLPDLLDQKKCLEAFAPELLAKLQPEHPDRRFWLSSLQEQDA